ncbi:MAG TPA: hypothetical protein VGK16_01030 [Candidatus Limnocylindrales bacterium]
MAALIVIALRAVVPLSILRFPLAGAIACLLLDAVDVVLVDAFARLLAEPPEFGSVYPALDKALDTWYLGFELFVAWTRWPEQALRRTAAVLFAWRLLGVIAFEVTAVRPLLLVFPNLFENVYLYVAIVRKWAPRLLPRSAAGLAIVIVVLLVPKLAQEWLLHFAQFHPWQWLKSTLG